MAQSRPGHTHCGFYIMGRSALVVGGALDVEGLALGSMQALLSALNVVRAPGESTHRYTYDSAGVAASFGSFTHLRVDGKRSVGFAPSSGFFRTRNGWVRTHGNYPHHEEALTRALQCSAATIADALAERDSDEVEETVTRNGGLAVAVRTPEQWRSTPMAEAVAGQPWISFDLTPGVPVELRRDGLPLAGVRVLDLTRVIAGPSATRLLGALGADVLRIDPPAYPELLNQHLDTGFAKRSVIADIRHPGTSGEFEALLADTDLVVLGYRPGALATWGWDAEALRERHPHLVTMTLSAWGEAGPWRTHRGFDSIVQAAVGIAHIYGSETADDGWRPGALPVQALDYATGVGVAAAAIALIGARMHGQRGSASLSLARTATELLAAAPPPPDAEAITLDVPMNTTHTEYGEITYVPPPLMVDDVRLDYPSPPTRMRLCRPSDVHLLLPE